MSAILQLFSLFAANVLIFDLGSFMVYREFRRAQAALQKQQFTDTVNSGNLESSAPAVSGVNRFTGAYSRLSDAARLIDMFTMAGMIHFSDNQCKLNPRNRDVTIALSSILIIGLADVGFHDNDSSCGIPRSLLITNAALLAGTVRATGNWLKESFLHVGFSAITFGMLNATTDNESVHCLAVSGIQKLDRHNLVLGALFAGVTGDIAEDEVRDKLKAACRRGGLGLVLLQMYVAITGGLNETDNTTVSSFVRVSGGG